MQTEDRVLESRKLFGDAFSFAGAGMILTDQEGVCIHVNRAFCEMTGYRECEVVGKDWLRLAHPDDAAPAHTRREEDRRFVQKNGQTIWVTNIVSSFRDERDKPVQVIVLVDVTERKRAAEAPPPADSSAQLRALAHRLSVVREQERTRLAREIHDELGQALTAIKIELASISPELPAGRPPARKLDGVLKLVDSTMHIVRTISTELRPGILDDLGLCAAVEWAAEDFERRTGIQCRAVLPPVEIKIDPEIATALFRILQEALTNVARHAGASRVVVTLSTRDGEVSLEVKDNGKGIAAKEISGQGSLGILGMRERADLLGGEFSITGDSALGTTAQVRIPNYNKQVAGASDA